jgi:hypothetical protein
MDAPIAPEQLRKISPAMARVVEARAMDMSIDHISDMEQVSVNSLNKRLDRVHKLLQVRSTTAAYRKLLLYGILQIR